MIAIVRLASGDFNNPVDAENSSRYRTERCASWNNLQTLNGSPDIQEEETLVRSPKRTLAALFALGFVISAIGVPSYVNTPIATAAQTWSVMAGYDSGPGQTGINYYPRDVTINAGDSISFSFPTAEPHTVAFDAGNVPGLFLTGITPNSPGPADLDITRAFSPVNTDGTSATYDGSQVISSGVPTAPPNERTPFTVTFQRAGVYYFECAVHGPDMSGTVTVEPSGSALIETPDQATSRGTREATQDATNTGVEAQAFAIKPAVAPNPNGGTVHTLSAGVSGAHTSVLQFLPSDYTVKRGDTITWTQADPVQFHTVTFLSGGTEPQFLQIVPQPGGPPQTSHSSGRQCPFGRQRLYGIRAGELRDAD